MKTAVQVPPREAGIDLADWNWKPPQAGPRQAFLKERYGIELGHSSCHNYLHRLDFVRKRPRKRLLKADATKREGFVRAYTALREEAKEHGAKIFFVDEAHFYADVDLRGKWVLKGDRAEVDGAPSGPDLDLRLVRLPAYIPDCNADAAIWAWIREEVTSNTCFGTKAKVQAAVDHCFQEVATRSTRGQATLPLRSTPPPTPPPC